MSYYQHVMYASKGTVRQVYSELFGDVNEVTVERGSSVGGSVGGKLGEFLASISGRFSGELTESEIHSINYDDDLFKAKKLANSILSDDELPYITDLSPEEIDPNQLYRFSCEVETKPFESEIDGEHYIQVSRNEGEIRFRGDTSTDNWGTRSHIIQSVRAAERGDTYPYQGLLWPLSVTEETEESVTYDVNFVLICGPTRELRDRWFDRMKV